jgi:hypothetical protein
MNWVHTGLAGDQEIKRTPRSLISRPPDLVISCMALMRMTRVAHITGGQETKRISRSLISRPPDLVISLYFVDANDRGRSSCRRPGDHENSKVIYFKAS